MAANASLNAAIAAFNKKDYNTAWREFMIAAQKGDAEAQAGVGAMLLNHINPPGTGYWAQCEKWLQLSANQGNAKGMTFLAKYYYDERGEHSRRHQSRRQQFSHSSGLAHAS